MPVSAPADKAQDSRRVFSCPVQKRNISAPVVQKKYRKIVIFIVQGGIIVFGNFILDVVEG